MDSIINHLEQVTKALQTERERQAQQDQSKQSNLSKLQEQYEEILQQYYKCEYDDLIIQFLDMLPLEERTRVQSKYSECIFLLHRIGIRVCDTLRRAFVEDKTNTASLIASPDISDIIALAVQKDLANFEPTSELLQQLDDFYSNVIASQGTRLHLVMKEKEQVLTVSLQRVFESQKRSVFQGIQIPADFKAAEEQFVKTVLPTFRKLMSIVGMLQDLIQQYFSFQKFSSVIVS